MAKNNWLPFEEAKVIIQNNGIRSQKEWNLYSKSDRPDNIPASPVRTYKGKWVSWNDWFGTEKKDLNFLNFEDAKK